MENSKTITAISHNTLDYHKVVALVDNLDIEDQKTFLEEIDKRIPGDNNLLEIIDKSRIKHKGIISENINDILACKSKLEHRNIHLIMSIVADTEYYGILIEFIMEMNDK